MNNQQQISKDNSDKANQGVVAIIVTYHPSAQNLERLCINLSKQVQHIVVVDNGSRDEDLDVLSALTVAVKLEKLHKNYGIAHAQNKGIEIAKAQYAADYVVLFDQDSSPAPEMVSKLIAAYERLSEQNQQVAALGPYYADDRQQQLSPFVKLGLFNLKRINQQNHPSNECEVEFLIASGSLIPMKVLDQIGLMQSELFIDHVDTEWCFRARAQGYRVYGVFDAQMKHVLGDQVVQFLRRRFSVRSPLRNYYLMRNSMWLYQQKSPSLHWKLVDAWRLLVKFVVYSLIVPPRLKHVKMMLKGIWHGLTKQMGQFKD